MSVISPVSSHSRRPLRVGVEWRPDRYDGRPARADAVRLRGGPSAAGTGRRDQNTDGRRTLLLVLVAGRCVVLRQRRRR